jgi:tetratricopeptide (TPR) repeat protein
MLGVASRVLWLSIYIFSSCALIVCAACNRSADSAQDGIFFPSATNKILAKANENIDSYLKTGNLRNLIEAEGILNQALIDFPNSDDIYVAAGNFYLNERYSESDPEYTAAEQKAKGFLDKALAINPNNPWARLFRAQTIEDRSKAAAEYEKIAELAPNWAIPFTHAGCNRNFLGEYEAAKVLLGKALERNQGPEVRYAHLRAREVLGRIYLREGEPERAKKVLLGIDKDTDAFNEDDGDTYACPFQALGELYRVLGQTDREMDNLLKAARMAPDRIPYQILASSRLLAIGDYEQALVFADRALQRSDESFAHVLKGFCFIFAKQYESAEKQFELATAINPEDLGAQVGMGHLQISRQTYEGAEAKLVPAIAEWLPKLIEKNFYQFDPPLAGVNFGIADKAFVRYGREQSGSSGILEAAPQGYLDTVVSMACLGMGWLHYNQRRFAESLEYFDLLLKLQPNNIAGRLSRGNTLVAMKRYEESEAIYKAILEKHPNNQYGLAQLAIVYLNQGKLEQSEAKFKEAMEHQDGGYSCPYEGLGLLYLKQGKKDQAKESFQKAIEINPRIEYKKFNGLAKILIEEGRIDKARELLKKSIENYPADKEAATLLAGLDRQKN